MFEPRQMFRFRHRFAARCVSAGAMAGGSAEKRKAEEADAAPEEGTRRSKRRRWDSADDSNAAKDDAGAAAETDASKAATDEPAAKKPALSLAEKLAKAKAAAAKAKELAEKLKGAKAAAGPAGPAPKAKGPSAAVQKALELAGKIRSGATAAASTAAAAKGPVSLRLNDKGQEVDEHGVLVTANEVAVSTFAVNAKSAKLEAFANAEKQAAEDVAGTGAEDWQDPRMGKGGRRRDRRSTFQVRPRSVRSLPRPALCFESSPRHCRRNASNTLSRGSLSLVAIFHLATSKR